MSRPHGCSPIQAILRTNCSGCGANDGVSKGPSSHAHKSLYVNGFQRTRAARFGQRPVQPGAELQVLQQEHPDECCPNLSPHGVGACPDERLDLLDVNVARSVPRPSVTICDKIVLGLTVEQRRTRPAQFGAFCSILPRPLDAGDGKYVPEMGFSSPRHQWFIPHRRAASRATWRGVRAPGSNRRGRS